MKTAIQHFLKLIFVFCFLSNSGIAQELILETPDNLGLSTERINRIDNMVNGLIDKGVISGAVTLVARHNKVEHLKAFGTKDADSDERMTTDQIFRIA